MKKLRNTTTTTTNEAGTDQTFFSSDFDIKGDESDLSYNLTDEKIALLVDGDMSPSERAKLLSFLAKNHECRRRVSEYVKLKGFEDNHKKNSKEKISSAIDQNDTQQNYNNEEDWQGHDSNEEDILTDREQSQKVYDRIDVDDDMDMGMNDDEFFGEVPPMLTQKAFDLFNKVDNKSKQIKKPQKSNTEMYEECEPVYINYSQDEYEIIGIIQPNVETTHLCLELHITKNGQPYKGEVYLYKGKVLYRRIKINKECITCDLSNKGNYHLYIKNDDIIEDKLELDFEVK